MRWSIRWNTSCGRCSQKCCFCSTLRLSRESSQARSPAVSCTAAQEWRALGGCGEAPEACSTAAYLYPIRWCGWWGLLSESCDPGRLDFCKADKCGCGGLSRGVLVPLCPNLPRWLTLRDLDYISLGLCGARGSPFSVTITPWTFPHTVKHPRFPLRFPSLTRGPHYFKERNYSVKIYLENFATLRCWKTWIGNPNYFNSKVIKL